MKTPIWASGFTSRPKAKLATKVGGVACFVAAARQELGIVATLIGAGKSLGHAIAYVIGASIVPLIIAIAGFELLRGVGKISGSLAALILIVDFALIGSQPASAQLVVSILVKVALLLLILNGVRGAFALRYVDLEQGIRDIFD